MSARTSEVAELKKLQKLIEENNEKQDKILHQNGIFISLLGRLAFTPEEIKKTVIERKRNPENYIIGYNACDGNHTISEIADIIGVSQGTLSPILANWEELGIIYEVVKPNGKFYKKLYPI